MKTFFFLYVCVSKKCFGDMLAVSQKMCGSFICNQIQTLCVVMSLTDYVRYYDLENQNRKEKIENIWFTVHTDRHVLCVTIIQYVAFKIHTYNYEIKSWIKSK